VAAKSLDSPPTIAHLKASGLTGVCTVCRACRNSGAVAFDAIGLPDERRSIPRHWPRLAVPLLGLRGM
jgi:hypothetical protein